MLYPVTSHLHRAARRRSPLLLHRKAALEAIEARERARANRTPASTVNKQKFLLGAYIMETRPQLAKSADFQAWLKRDQDRSIFGLAPLKPPIAGNGN